jgi:hypothetical protein
VDSAALLSLRFNPEDDLLAATRDCEAEVFLRTYGNTRQQLADEYGPYEQASVFIALADHGGDVLGACRLIRPTELGLKSLDDAARPPWSLDVARSARAARLDLSQTWDVATLGCRRGLKGPGKLAGAALFHALVQVVRANEIRSAVMIIDERVRALLASAGMTGRTMPGAQPARYLGSAASTPVYRHCDEAFDQQRVTNPDAHRLFTQGIGLDGITVPPLAEFRYAERSRVSSASPAQAVGASA